VANAHDFVCKLPHGYDTLVGERGHTLSGGERQRISIARAVLSNPRILILDEATSAVDTETEQNIQEAMDRLVKGRTVFAIAHRLSTLRRASRLFVVQDGKLREQGTHAELYANPEGTYRRLYQLQQKLHDAT
jgi:ATP-binding cassette subfamily B protein